MESESLRGNVRLWLGLGLFLSWIFTLLSFEGAIRNEQEGIFTGIVHDPFFLAATLTAAIVLVLAGFIPFSTYRKIVGSHFLPASIALTSLAALAVVVCGIVLTQNPYSAVACGIAVGVAVAYFSLVWSALFATKEFKLVIKLAAATISVVAIVSVACRCIGSIHVFFSVIANLTCLVASVMLLFSLPRNLPLPPITGVKRPLLLRACALSFTLGFSCEYSWTFFLKGSALYQSTGFAIEYMIGGLLAVALMLLPVFRKAKLGVKLSFAYDLMIFVIICSLCLELFSNEVLYLAYVTNQIAYYFTQVTIWVVMFVLTFKLSDSPFRVGGLVFGFMYFGTFAGFETCSSLSDLLLRSHVMSNAIIATVLVCVAFVALFVFRASDLTHLAKQGELAISSNYDSKLAEVAKASGLSPRETDVFCLLAKGRNAVFIQEQLVLSYSTVSTHRQNIYRKLDVHTQQELLDFVERAMMQY